MDKVKIITNNVRGLAEYSKRRNCFHYYHIKMYDIILLQETHFQKKHEKLISMQWGSKVWNSYGTNLARGVSVLFKKGLNYEVHNVITDEEGHYILLYSTLNKRKVLIGNVYAPNTDDPVFFRNLFKDIERFTPQYTIIGGDFNLVLDLNVDKQGG